MELVCQDDASIGHASSRRKPPPMLSMHPAHICREEDAGLVPRGSECSGASSQSLGLFGSRPATRELLVPDRNAGVVEFRRRTFPPLCVAGRWPMSLATKLVGPFLQGFFTDFLCNQKRASPQTVASCRDTFRLFLPFLTGKTGIARADLRITDLYSSRKKDVRNERFPSGRTQLECFVLGSKNHAVLRPTLYSQMPAASL